MRRCIYVILLLLAAVTPAFAQPLRVDVSDMPLDRVIAGLGVRVSLDSRALSAYNVTLKKTFGDPKQAIDFLLRGKPFACEVLDGVFVISPVPEQETVKYHTFACTLTDAESGEALPYGYVKTSRGTVLADAGGYLSLKSDRDEPLSVSVNYLGYAPVDTLLEAGTHKLKLSPRPVSISKIIVKNSPAAMMMQSGARSGESRINHNIARYMPGSGDNSAFNLLRMMPGVRASGEPSEELVVWGSSGGESRITFDGFTLYGMRGFNDNISSVNPYMVKDIRLMKGGYDASYGNRSGAVAEITGVDGRTARPSLKADISTLTGNIYGSVPVTERSALSVAYRQTFYNLYENELLNPYNGRKPSGKGKGKGQGPGASENESADMYVLPDYAFRDMNIKYSGESEKSRFYVSLYGAGDNFDFTVKEEDGANTDAAQKSRQYAGAAHYDRKWGNGSSTRFTVSFSQFSSEEKHVTVSGGQNNQTSVFDVDNRIREMSAKAGHTFNIGRRNKMKVGGEVAHYTCRLNLADTDRTVSSLYVSDELGLGGLTLDAGLRGDIVSGDFRLQPRLSVRFQVTDNLNATASWGLYDQYIAKIPVEPGGGHYSFVWQAVEPVSSMHSAAGLAYSRSGFLASVEGYNRRVKDAVRLLESGAVITDIDVWGVDIFLKKDFSKATLFGAYSYSDIDRPQKEAGHEIKAGAIVTLLSFILSANYVYGTGFNVLNLGGAGQGQGAGQAVNHTVPDGDYSRLDVAATYRKRFKAWTVQAGVSLMNVFDTKNIKYSYGTGSKTDPVTLYTQALPFTPMVFVEVLF